MRISELIDREVVDESGHRIGAIHDVRLIQDVPGPQDAPALFRVDAVLVGPRGVAIRLGYAPGTVRGPWLVRWVLTTLARHHREIAWKELREQDGHYVVSRSDGR